MQAPPTVIVLAAGLGSRFVGAHHKLVQPVRDDEGKPTPILALTLRHAIESRMPVVVVTTSTLAPLAAEQVAARDIVVVPAAAPVSGRGMGDSIASGVAARADAPGWLILPADMPRVRPATLHAVAKALLSGPIAYAQYKGRRGHPVGFDAELYSELIALTGDEGARRIVARYPAQAVDVDDPGVLIDIDTIQDLDEGRDGASDFQPSAFAPPLY
ncbi:MAG: nucleotidyltransferase family protein [Aquincola sp.]|nr:nucleotidyltransferase family protein [Aquincola sp.]MDH4288953.1 nucleotidyltransferase family protein [Aquincola sp.]MDH5329254.1 nucleotidyltransferase family protein [Aquincola sp.]